MFDLGPHLHGYFRDYSYTYVTQNLEIIFKSVNMEKIARDRSDVRSSLTYLLNPIPTRCCHMILQGPLITDGRNSCK